MTYSHNPAALFAAACTMAVWSMPALADEPPVRANPLNYSCASDNGFTGGECGFVAGCLLSQAVGGFDCYQILEGETRPYWPVPMPQPNEIFPEDDYMLPGGGNGGWCGVKNPCEIQTQIEIDPLDNALR